MEVKEVIYRKGTIGRVFVARIEQGEDLLGELRQLAVQEKIAAGVIYVIGGVAEASAVVGSEKCTVPPVAIWREFSDGREMVGIGTLLMDDQKQPVIHLHAALGREDLSNTACLRKRSEVYLMVEAIVLELLDTGAIKTYDAACEANMLCFK